MRPPLLRLLLLALVALLLSLSLVGVYYWRHLHQRLTPPASWEAASPMPTDSSVLRREAAPGPDSTFSPQEFFHPSRLYRPWVRWWWPHPFPHTDQLLGDVQQLADWGLGGASVQLTTAGMAAADRPTWHPSLLQPWPGSPLGYRWALLLREARKRGLTLDWMPASGWPAGASHLDAAEQLSTLSFGEVHVLGGKRIRIPLPQPPVPTSYLITAWAEAAALPQTTALHWQPDSARLIDLIAVRVRTHERNPIPLVLTDYLQIEVDSTLRIHSYVNAQGQIDWDAPPGYWEVIAVYQQPSGQQALWNPGQPPTWVSNPFDASLQQRLLPQAAGLGLASDSLPDARAWRGLSLPSLLWLTEQVFDTALVRYFATTRGYDLRPWLPALSVPGADHALFNHWQLRRSAAYRLGSADHRVREDYYRARSSFLLEKVQPRQRQALARHGLALRERPYAPHGDLIRAAGQAGIPTVSQAYAGAQLTYLRQISSGAWLYERPLVAGDWLNVYQQTGSLTPAAVLRQARQALLAGVNQLEWQGWASPHFLSRAYGPLGWHPFASPYFKAGIMGTRWGIPQLFTTYAHALNTRIARLQYAMQLGRPAVDVYVYYPFLGYPSQADSLTSHLPPTPAALQEWQAWTGQQPDPRRQWLDKVTPLLDLLESLGYTWAWVNDHWLQEANLEEGYLRRGSVQVQQVALLEVPTMPLETMSTLVSLLRSGGEVLTYGQVPQRVPGYRDYARQDSLLRQLGRELIPATVAQNREDLHNLLIGRPPRQPVAYAGNYPFLRHLRRELPGGSQLLLLSNEQDQDRFFDLELDPTLRWAYWLDPGRGRIYADTVDERGRLRGYLGPQDCRLLLLSQEAFLPDSVLSPRRLLETGLMGRERINERRLEQWQFIAQLPEGYFTRSDTSLFDWRATAELRFYAGEGLYTTQFYLGDTLPDRAYVLDLGQVEGVAEVRLNTQAIDTLLAPPYRLDLSPYVQRGNNTLEIWLAVPPRNEWVGRARQGEPGFGPYRALPLIPVGLLGPVRLLEIALPTTGPD